MAADQNDAAENPLHASSEYPTDERVNPEIFALQLFEHLADVHGDANADLYLARVIAELFELSPIVREHVSDLILADLAEELHRHGRAGKDALRMVGEVQRHWQSERG